MKEFMARSILTKLLFFAVIAALISACATYGHKQFAPQPAMGRAYTSFVVEVDDYGSFWDRGTAQRALNAVSEQSRQRNAVVVLYVHGWHHNASAEDSNLEGFHKSLSELMKTLDKAPYREARVQLTDKADVEVIGIYVGWRGRSLPGLLDYLTFWGRKAAAERVGAGDVREFILRLQQIYEERNELGEARKGPFMGLVTVGHSFGGQVLFKSVSSAIESDLIRAGKSLAGASQQRAELITTLNGIGDITVLLNPALEAYQFERIHQLYSSFSYDCLQTPVLLVVSGEDDSARQFWFPAGQWLGRVFRPSFQSDAQNDLWHRALGEYEPHRTHRLEAHHYDNSLSVEDYANPALIIKADFTASITLGEGFLMPVEGRRQKPYSPVVVAYSSRKLIQGHNGIFTETFRQFLIDYVAFIEGKRMTLRALKATTEACR